MNLSVTPGTTAARVVALSLMVTLAITYSLVLSLNRIATTAGIPFIPYVFWQILGATILLWILCLARGRRPPVTRNALISYLIIGFFGYAVAFSALAAAAPRAPASVISLTLTLTPVLVYSFAVLVRMDRLYASRALGIASSLGGVLLVLIPPLLQSASLLTAEMVPWVMLALVAPLCYAIANLSAARFRPEASGNVEVATGVLTASTVFMLPIMAYDGSWWFFDVSFADGSYTILVAAIIDALFMVLMYEVIRLAGPVVFSTYNYISTLCGIGWAAALFGEKPTVWIWAALALLFVGLYLVNRSPRAAPKEAA